MAIDSRNKRFSMIGLSNPTPSILATPDTTIAASDRALLLFLYAGLALAADVDETAVVAGKVYMGSRYKSNALADAVQGAKRPGQLITWYDQDGSVFPLSNATITARVHFNGSGSPSNSDGTFTVTDALNGKFRWDYSTNDVEIAGGHSVQFTAVFDGSPTPAKTNVTEWFVHKAL